MSTILSVCLYSIRLHVTSQDYKRSSYTNHLLILFCAPTDRRWSIVFITASDLAWMKNSRCFQLGHFTQVNNCLHLCLSYFQSSFLVHLSSLRYQYHSISVIPWIITHRLGIFCFIKYGFFNRIKIHFCLYSSCLPAMLSVSQSVYISVSSF